MRNFASTLVKFSKLSHIQTTIWRPPRVAGSAEGFCYATDEGKLFTIISDNTVEIELQKHAGEGFIIKE